MKKTTQQSIVGKEMKKQKVVFENPERTVYVYFGENDGASMGSGICYLPENSSNENHTHYEEDEVIFVLQGEIKFVFPSYERVLKPFEAIYIPKNEEHQIFNIGKGVAAHTFTFAPAGNEKNILNKYK